MSTAVLDHRTHLETVMGTVVGITSPDPLPDPGLAAAVRILHEADRVFSTWNPESPISRLRSGRCALEELPWADVAVIDEVLEHCRQVRDLTDGAFDPWAMPGGVDPTGLVKGWAAQQACRALVDHGVASVMVNAGGDITVTGRPDDRPRRIAVRHPAQPGSYAAVIEVTAAVATSGNYERPGQLIEPSTGKAAWVAVSATVTGPDLGQADALATGLAVRGKPLLAAIDHLPGYEAYLITEEGRHFATPGITFVQADARHEDAVVSPDEPGSPGRAGHGGSASAR
jgi:thiamine biosynthesis lipoprotein